MQPVYSQVSLFISFEYFLFHRNPQTFKWIKNNQMACSCIFLMKSNFLFLFTEEVLLLMLCDTPIADY